MLLPPAISQRPARRESESRRVQDCRVGDNASRMPPAGSTSSSMGRDTCRVTARLTAGGSRRARRIESPAGASSINADGRRGEPPRGTHAIVALDPRAGSAMLERGRDSQHEWESVGCVVVAKAVTTSARRPPGLDAACEGWICLANFRDMREHQHVVNTALTIEEGPARSRWSDRELWRVGRRDREVRLDDNRATRGRFDR